MRNLIILLFLIILFFSGCRAWKPASDKGHHGIEKVTAESRITPFFTGSSENILVTINVNVRDAGKTRNLKGIGLRFSKVSKVDCISGIRFLCGMAGDPVSEYQEMSSFSLNNKEAVISGQYIFKNGENRFVVKISLKEDADSDSKIGLENLRLILDEGTLIPVPVENVPEYRFAKVLRAARQDNVNTYRIPGLVTTGAGTLIAVYDIRHNSSRDLQEDIDIGMSRSTDGGKTWEAMKVIMDMGEYGGMPQRQNGTGDPCILYDNVTGTIFVAALWMNSSVPESVLWWASGPGMSPRETGQFMLVRSSDDGLTWSQPVSITSQIKDPAWQLLLQGPGRGITMKDGTLVFPAQFKADIGEKAIDGGQYTCHSTIVYSKDHGNIWHIGTGAKTNTTESQVVELSDGSLMLNMRDDRNRTDKGETNGRAVSVTKDMGRTWIIHPSSNHSLPEPQCQASLIAADIDVSGRLKKVLFFSNPDNKMKRSDMTIKASFDEGTTWPAGYQLELNQDEGYGYSCLTMIDNETVGILYEGIKNIYFQRIPVKDILKGVK